MVGIVKIFRTAEKIYKEQKKKFFDNYGIDRKGIRSIGFAELISGVALLFWSRNLNVGLTAAIALLLITAGAAYFHLVYDEKPAPQAAITLFALVAGFIVTILL